MNEELDKYLKNMIPESPEDELIKMVYFFRKFHLRGDYSESNMVKVIKGYYKKNIEKGSPYQNQTKQKIEKRFRRKINEFKIFSRTYGSKITGFR